MTNTAARNAMTVDDYIARMQAFHDITKSEDASNVLKNLACLQNKWPTLRKCPVEVIENHALPLPPTANRGRVQGKNITFDEDGVYFLKAGADQLRLVFNIFDVYSGLHPDLAILDWGVGCGKAARHMPVQFQNKFNGIDVDPVNIEWCQTNIPFGTYQAVDPYQKTKFANNSFDLIYSHSVLTHLVEKDQFFWLQELARICKGIMVLSVHGLYSSAKLAGWAKNPAELFQWLQTGFKLSDLDNPDIEDVVDEGYYRDVAHTPYYIQSKWSEYVDILDIIPGGFGSFHDAVVCRAKA